jgi:transglutaminase-like putative cysteine protease
MRPLHAVVFLTAAPQVMVAKFMDTLVRHITRYTYGQPVKLGRHRLMLRPRDSFDLRLMKTGLAISPAASLRWSHDVYGNSIAWATFETPADMLEIDSELVIRRYQPTAPKPALAPWQDGAPIAYSETDRIVLQPFIDPATEDRIGQLDAFAHSGVTTIGAVDNHPLRALARRIHETLSYQIRHAEGTQHPCDTLDRGYGTCRDYAWLFIECARRLGYAARFVTGYLHPGDQNGAALAAPSIGYSHAWADVYVPGDGWVEFDPTNLLVADRQLLRVAVTRTPAEASPILGSFTGSAPSVAPEVSVTVTRIDQFERQAS